MRAAALFDRPLGMPSASPITNATTPLPVLPSAPRGAKAPCSSAHHRRLRARRPGRSPVRPLPVARRFDLNLLTFHPAPNARQIVVRNRAHFFFFQSPAAMMMNFKGAEPFVLVSPRRSMRLATVARMTTAFAPGLAGFPTRLSFPIVIWSDQGRMESSRRSRTSRDRFGPHLTPVSAASITSWYAYTFRVHPQAVQIVERARLRQEHVHTMSTKSISTHWPRGKPSIEIACQPCLPSASSTASAMAATCDRHVQSSARGSRRSRLCPRHR